MHSLTYFISDLHLGASYIPDAHEHERRICRWLRSIAPTARTIYMLGDVLDYWYEYRYVVPRGFTRFSALSPNSPTAEWKSCGSKAIMIYGFLIIFLLN